MYQSVGTRSLKVITLMYQRCLQTRKMMDDMASQAKDQMDTPEFRAKMEEMASSLADLDLPKRLAFLKDDPELADVFADVFAGVEEGGVDAFTKYWDDPVVLKELAEKHGNTRLAALAAALPPKRSAPAPAASAQQAKRAQEAPTGWVQEAQEAKRAQVAKRAQQAKRAQEAKRAQPVPEVKDLFDAAKCAPVCHLIC